MTSEEYISRLRENLTKKHRLLEEILELTRRQADSIIEDSIDNLGKLIDDKQIRIDAINKLDEDFNVYFQRLKRELKVNSLDELGKAGIKGAPELKAATAGILKLVGEISSMEKSNSDNARKLLKNLGDEVRKINQGKKVSSVYTPPPANIPSYYFDKKK